MEANEDLFREENLENREIDASEADDEFTDELLAELLVQSSLLTPEQLASAQARVASWDGPAPIPMGPSAFVTLSQNAVVLGDQEVALSDALAVDPTDWPRFSNGRVLVLDGMEPKIHREIETKSELGLIPTPAGCFLHPGETPQRETSPQLSTLFHPQIAASAVRSGPIDLYGTREFLVAVNRGGGTVHVLVPQSGTQLGALALRAAGSKRTMGVAIHGKTAYFTDGLTPRLTILDLPSWKVRHQTFPTGPLGSLLVSPDGTLLHICFYKNNDELGFLTVSTADLRVRHLLNLPARKVADGPGEVLVINGAGTLAYLLAGSLEIPHAFQLLGIDLGKKKVAKALPLGQLPLGLAFEPPAGWLPKRRTLRESVVELGLASDGEIEHLLTHDPTMSPLDDPTLDPSVLTQLPERLIRMMGIVPMNRQGQTLQVAMVNPQDGTSRQLAQQLAGNLQLKVVPIEQGDLDNFLATRYPVLLENLASMRMVTPEEKKEEKKKEEKPEKPDHKPRPVAKPKTEIPCSVDQWSWDGHVLFVEGLKRFVLELDEDKKEVWSFKGALIGYAAHLPTGNTLLLDLGNQRVIEVDPARQIVWQFGDPSDRAKQLRSPRGVSRLSNGHTLIADTGNHRVIEVDARGEIVWHYGEWGRAGCSGQSLFKPQWARRLPNGNTLIVDSGNHRVIEVDIAKTIVWQYGNSANRLGSGQGSGLNQLSEPSSATLLPGGNYLLVDSGNQRVLEVDPMRQLQWHYRPGAIKAGIPVKDPILATRLPNGRFLICGRQGMVEVDADLKAHWDFHPHKEEKKDPLPTEATKVIPKAEEPKKLGVNPPANLPDTFLMIDRNANRIAEIDRKHQVAWQFTGLAGGEKNRLFHPHYAVRLPSGSTLVADTGNHRVVELRDNGVVWQFGRKGEPGSTPKQLYQPRSAERSGGHTMIADTGNRRIVEVNSAQEIIWTKGDLNSPAHAIRLPYGNVLVTLWGDHQVIELDDAGRIVWSYGQTGYAGKGENQLFHPEFATRLESGHTLIADTQNHRVLEVNRDRQIVWQYGGDPQFLGRIGRFGMQFNTPVSAWRLESGNTVVIHAGKNHAVELDPELNILWQHTLG
ncbi:MAG: hypothetical protein ACM3YO_00675 [Bacteroidota bacterium]